MGYKIDTDVIYLINYLGQRKNYCFLIPFFVPYAGSVLFCWWRCELFVNFL